MFKIMMLKKVVKSICVLLIALCTNNNLTAQPEIGIQLYSFRNEIPKDLPGMLSKINEMGFRYIEGGGTLEFIMGSKPNKKWGVGPGK